MFGMLKGDCICIRTAVCHFHSPNRLFCCRDPGTLGYDPRQFGRHWVRRLGEPDVPASSRRSSLEILIHCENLDECQPKTGDFSKCVNSAAAPLRNRNTYGFSQSPIKAPGFWNPRMTWLGPSISSMACDIMWLHIQGRCSIGVSLSPGCLGGCHPKWEDRARFRKEGADWAKPIDDLSVARLWRPRVERWHRGVMPQHHDLSRQGDFCDTWLFRWYPLVI